MADMKKTGGGPIKAKPLTDLENDLLQTIGPVVVGGITGIAEASGLQVRNCFNLFFHFCMWILYYLCRLYIFIYLFGLNFMVNFKV